jgi:hypothetical protein
MSVWPEFLSDRPSLNGREGELLSVSIAVDPAFLESLLESLAQVSFPINPQIYHEARIVTVYADQREESLNTTLVEFPAYEGQLEEVRRVVIAYGFEPSSILVSGMLEQIHAESPSEQVPEGAEYVRRYRVKSRGATAVH